MSHRLTPKAPCKTGPGRRPPKPQLMDLEEADTDNSGDLSAEEFVAYQSVRMKCFFESLDKNRDSKLTGDEFNRIQRGPSAPQSQPAAARAAAESVRIKRKSA